MKLKNAITSLLCAMLSCVGFVQYMTLPASAKKKTQAPKTAELAEKGEKEAGSTEDASSISDPGAEQAASGKQHGKQETKQDKTAAEPQEVKFQGPIRVTPTVTYGTPAWVPKRVASTIPAGMPAKPATSAAFPVSPNAVPQNNLVPEIQTKSVDLERRLPDQPATLNVRIVKHYHLPPTDTVMAYPWPVKPPKPVPASKLPDKPESLKSMILASGYSNRVDFRRPHPLYGWRWVHAFTVAHGRSGLGFPHTILTMYPWVSKMMPFVIAEVRKVNAIEEDRLNCWKKVNEEYEQLHEELENEAAAKGVFPVEVKVGPHGIGQTQLPAGNWWISATRKLPDLKFYWQVPVTVSAGQTVNVELTNVNAIVVQGGW